ncbi:glycosyltransferase family 4 protein [Priestia sp. FSL W8-0001]|uniref:glycosyltransferase family 4 protein n=1 Tax=unclassified Priestia TaxID=2800374 RepID=UPI0030FA46B7
MIPKKLGYLSGAPRVSTKENAQEGGARSHVLGVINGFQASEIEVKEYILGNMISENIKTKSEEKFTKNKLFTLASDIVRILLGYSNSKKAWKNFGHDVDWVYERYAAMQALGNKFKKNKKTWILETNGIIYKEAVTERNAIVLSKIAKFLELRAYRKCDVLICVSDTLKEIIVREANIPENKVLVVPNGVDTNRFAPGIYEPKKLSDEFTIGFVGSLYPWQGINYLVQAIHLLKEKGITINLTIVGDGPKKNEWEELSKNLGLSSQVKFVGRVPGNEVPNYVEGFDLCFSGQVDLENEKMYHSPLKLYEYMSMGKPVIATSYKDAKKLIEGKETGFLFIPKNVNDLAEKINVAYSLNDRLVNYGKNARQEILLNHSWEQRVKELIPKVIEITEDTNV